MSAPSEVLKRARPIQLLCLDVDGILTDGRLYFLSNGVEAKAFHIRDGLGLKMLMNAGIKTALITGRNSEAAKARAAELGLNYFHQGVRDKRKVVHELRAEMAIEMAAVAFMGDDLPDICALRACGLAVTVPEAPGAVRAYTHYVTRESGGQGAVREVCELILDAKDLLQTELDRYLA
jgi:3-deoxy-D-manno-octulosonate 8-phosphate phosphatase (KDO 8-P phosphatase)